MLDKKRQQLEASGECYTEEASQQVGGLIANGVHDTMQRAFTPETVPSLEAPSPAPAPAPPPLTPTLTPP